MSAGVRAGETDLAEQNRHHGDRAAGGFAVSLTLRAPALGNKEGLCHRHFAREAPDHIHRNAGDGGCPFRGLCRTVGTRAEDIGLVVRLRGGGFRKRLLIEPHAVAVKERLIDPAIRNEFVGESRDEGSVCPRADRDPLIGACRAGIRERRVDHDDFLRAVTRKRGVNLEALAAAGRPRDRRIVAEKHVELGVRDFTREGTRAAAVGLREGRGPLSV